MEAAIYIIVLLHMKEISSALSKYSVGKFEESRGNVNQAGLKHRALLGYSFHLHLFTATTNVLMRNAGAKRTKSGKIDVSCWMKTGFPPQMISSTVKDIFTLI